MTNQLPEPNFIERDAQKITQEWIALYEERTGKTLQAGQIDRIWLDIGVYRENLLRIKIQETAKQNLLNFATYPVLDYLGELVGVTRVPATFAQTSVRFSLSEPLDFDLQIAQNTEIESKDGKYSFLTNDPAAIKRGSLFVDVDCTCNIAGADANGYLRGDINNLITPIPYVQDCINTAESYGGADDEDDEQLRLRIKQAPEQFSNAGTEGAYIYHTKSAHPDIIDVAIFSSSPGLVDIYPLLKSGNPSDEVLKSIHSYVSDNKIRALGDCVTVNSPQRVDFKIKVDLTLFKFADSKSVITQANEALQQYVQSMRVKLGRDIVPTQIVGVLSNIYGVYKVDLISPSFTHLQKFNWANCLDIDIQVKGVADE